MVLGEDLEKPSPAQTALYTLEYALRGKIIWGREWLLSTYKGWRTRVGKHSLIEHVRYEGGQVGFINSSALFLLMFFFVFSFYFW